jgi:CRP/FNR family transcriptional regulator
MPKPAADNAARSNRSRTSLEEVPFFRQAPPDLKKAMTATAAVVRLDAGEYFLREGDTCRHFAILVSGRIRVFKLGEGGHEITLYHVGPGEACPLNVSCILSDREVPAMAMVEEAVEAVLIPAAEFRRLVARYEPLRSFIFRMFSTRLTDVMSLVEEVAFRRMDQRLARRLEELFGQGDGSRPEIGITHAEIAGELGTAREVVSRLLKDFERRGALHLSRGRVRLQSAELLRKIATRGAD